MDVNLTFRDLASLAANRKVEKAGMTFTIERPILSKISINPPKGGEAIFFLDEADERSAAAVQTANPKLRMSAPKTERVRFEGSLRGNGKEATCSGWCNRTTLFNNNLPFDVAFGDYDINDQSVSPRLPAGVYELIADGRRPNKRYTLLNGRWIEG